MDVTVNITYANQQLPGSTPAVDHIRVTIAGVQPANLYEHVVPPGTASTVFSRPLPDTYTVTVQAEDISNNPIGSPQTGTVVVPAATVTRSVPSAVSETVA